MPPKPTLLYGAGALPALNASITTLAPLTAGMPKLSAAWPDRKLTMPTLKVSCACVVPIRHSAAAPTSECASRRDAAPRSAVEAMDVSVVEPAGAQAPAEAALDHTGDIPSLRAGPGGGTRESPDLIPIPAPARVTPASR